MLTASKKTNLCSRREHDEKKTPLLFIYFSFYFCLSNLVVLLNEVRFQFNNSLFPVESNKFHRKFDGVSCRLRDYDNSTSISAFSKRNS